MGLFFFFFLNLGLHQTNPSQTLVLPFIEHAIQGNRLFCFVLNMLFKSNTWPEEKFFAKCNLAKRTKQSPFLNSAQITGIDTSDFLLIFLG